MSRNEMGLSGRSQWRIERRRKNERGLGSISSAKAARDNNGIDDDGDSSDDVDDTLPGAYAVSLEFSVESAEPSWDADDEIVTSTGESFASNIHDPERPDSENDTNHNNRGDDDDAPNSILNAQEEEEEFQEERSHELKKTKTWRFIAILIVICLIAIASTTVFALNHNNQTQHKSVCTVNRKLLVECTSGHLEVPLCAWDVFEKLALELLHEHTPHQYPCDVRHFGLVAVAVSMVNSDDPIDNISQYWTLAIIYFALGGPNWLVDRNWLTGKSACHQDWFGVTCSQDNTSVISIKMISNNLIGSLPTEITFLSSLHQIVLFDSDISGTIPSQIGVLRYLSDLSIQNAQISGTMPSELGICQSMKDLVLFAVNIAGTIPTEIGNMSKLENLALSSASIEGTIPTELGLLSNLQVLSLSKMRNLSGMLPSPFVNLSKLSQLLISGSFKSDVLLSSFLSRLPKTLVSLTLYDSRLNASIPPNISLFSNLTDLSLTHLLLSGTLPTEIGLMTRLRKLDLSYLKLEGKIPSEIGRLTHLMELTIEGSTFTSTLPSEIAQIPDLEINY